MVISSFLNKCLKDLFLYGNVKKHMKADSEVYQTLDCVLLFYVRQATADSMS